jgi:site-specific DNA-methyltransferase (adenine-specific)
MCYFSTGYPTNELNNMKIRAPANRTLSCPPAEEDALRARLLQLHFNTDTTALAEQVICQDWFSAAPFLPRAFVDLLILDPPYNLRKNYHGHLFQAQSAENYQTWFEELIITLLPLLKPCASIYVCSDWQTSALIFPVLNKYLHVRNRITWEREKGRGAKRNWKNNSEDIWFCTRGKDYYFNVDAVKLRRKVLAPYRRADGAPKDWDDSASGKFRLTHPANMWTDITVPFWSMPENTEHPTQKPEKLIAKLVLASSQAGDWIFDPFLGSGTTAVVAKKLGRCFTGVEQNPQYCCWALKRLENAARDPAIQGYADGVFWERNSAP